MSISAEQVRALREKSGAGMLDCKNALVACNGSMEEAIIYLQKKGLADVANRKDRLTNLGRIFTLNNDRYAVILELLCETDFVARNDTFIALGQEIAEIFIGIENENDCQLQVESLIKRGISVIKENIQLKRHTLIVLEQNQCVNSYIHGDDGSLGALVIGSVGDVKTIDHAKLDTLLHDIAMHVSAYRPRYLSEDSVPADYREQQLQIFSEQAKSSGKPDNIVEKIAGGKLRKHFGEICLLEQGFIREEKKSVKSILAEAGKQLGQDIHIAQIVCYKAGEQQE